MPVIVPPGAHAEWLDPRSQDTERLDRLLAPYPAQELVVHAVSRRVNDARNDEPTLTLEAAAGQPRLV